MFMVAQAYSLGCGVARDAAMAKHWFERAIDNGDVQAMLMYLAGDGVEKNGKASFDLFRRATELGNGEAMGRIGFMLAFGQGVDRDVNAAMEWLNRGVNTGDSNVLFLLAYSFMCGFHGERNVAKGSQMVRRAAEMGENSAIAGVKLGYVFNVTFEKVHLI
jgi:TPR repeat protein